MKYKKIRFFISLLSTVLAFANSNAQEGPAPSRTARGDNAAFDNMDNMNKDMDTTKNSDRSFDSSYSDRTVNKSNNLDSSYSDRSAGSLVIKFEVGRYALTKDELAKLSDFVDKANISVSNNQIEAAVWADAETSAGKSLPQSAWRLANQRIQQINNFLKAKYNTSAVKFYNMAEGKNWVAKAINSREPELKSLFSKKMAPPMSDKDLEVIKNNGAASRAVLVITHLD